MSSSSTTTNNSKSALNELLDSDNYEYKIKT